MNKDFLSWLGHAGSHTCMIQNAGTTYYFVRVQKNEDFDYLYCQRQYSGKGLARGGTFKYAGIFCRRDGELYDAQYDVQGLAGEDTQDGQNPHGDAHTQGNFFRILEFGVELAEEDALGDLDEGSQGQHGGDQRNDADKDEEEVVALGALFKGCLVDVPLGGKAVEGGQAADGSGADEEQDAGAGHLLCQTTQLI